MNYFLSQGDREVILKLYPPMSTLNKEKNKNVLKRTLELDLKDGKSKTFSFTPSSSGLYKITVIGDFDVLLIVFDPDSNKLAADDDTDYKEEYHQAKVIIPLEEHTTYSIFVRVYGSDVEYPTAVLFAKKVGEIKS